MNIFICDHCLNFKQASKPSGSTKYPNQLYYYHICDVDSKEVIYSDPSCSNFQPNQENELRYKLVELENRINKMEIEKQ